MNPVVNSNTIFGESVELVDPAWMTVGPYDVHGEQGEFIPPFS